MELSTQAARTELCRTVYSETQNWARHNETLLLAVNTILLGAWGTLYAQSFTSENSHAFFSVLTVATAILGGLVTWRLNAQYKQAIHRVVVYERCFALHEPDPLVWPKLSQEERVGWGHSFVPAYLHRLPHSYERSAWIFYVFHGALLFFGMFTLASRSGA